MASPTFPPMPEPTAHLHSNGECCADRHVNSRDWPVNLFTASQMDERYLQGFRDAREAAARQCNLIAAANNESGWAIKCAAAIRSLPDPVKEPTP